MLVVCIEYVDTMQHDIDFVKADIGQPYEKDDSYKPNIDSIIAAALSERLCLIFVICLCWM